ncbi:hypothetical protein SAMN05216188_11857 [Lentzea xinjiangensis]|uniref:Uncharacterized protein n=1 Tax=Lentzea xinjiangensis TaxID=402600 RepID=A0A1H9TDY3_9PSEU|nr:hypothetical protein [Lentzea xinjiangensis]SER95316.1 hypothetical protein SAMN05216188_11857 [Lentzea xinjiangensis]
MPTFERFSGAHRAALVRTHDKAEIAKYRRLAEDGTDGWREVKESKPAKAETPKAQPLTDAEKKAAVDAKLLANAGAEHDPAEIRAKLAELAAK